MTAIYKKREFMDADDAYAYYGFLRNHGYNPTIKRKSGKGSKYVVKSGEGPKRVIRHHKIDEYPKYMHGDERPVERGGYIQHKGGPPYRVGSKFQPYGPSS